jgi:predicted dehydrogenase
MPTQLRVAIVGTGFIGRVHARSARLAGGRVVGVLASSGSRSRAAADDLDVERAFASFDEIAGDAVDVVHICTPNHLHAEMAIAALESGKHVVCEKPIAVTSAQGERLADAVANAPGILAVPFVYRYHPVVRHARALARSGGLGEIRLIHGSYLQDWLASPDDTNWRVDARLGGASRAFADIGSHWCDLVEFVTGHRFTALVASTATFVRERPQAEHRESFGRADVAGAPVPVTTEDAASVILRTDRGALATVAVSQVSPGRKNRLWFEIDGSEGSLVFDQEQPETLWHGGRAGNRIVVRDEAQLDPAAARFAVVPAGHPQGYLDCFDAFVRDVYDAIRTGVVPEGLPTVADGLRTVRLTDAVLHAAGEATWQPMGAAVRT